MFIFESGNNLHAPRSVRYDHGSCRNMAGAPIWIILVAIGVVLTIAVIVVVVMLRSPPMHS